MKTFQLMKHARLFQNILGIPRMIKKPGNLGKSRACLENAQLFLQTTNTCPAFSTKTAYPAQTKIEKTTGFALLSDYCACTLGDPPNGGSGTSTC